MSDLSAAPAADETEIITVRYWASARSAAGVDADQLPVHGPDHADRGALQGHRPAPRLPARRGAPGLLGAGRRPPGLLGGARRRPGRARGRRWSSCRRSRADEPHERRRLGRRRGGRGRGGLRSLPGRDRRPVPRHPSGPGRRGRGRRTERAGRGERRRRHTVGRSQLGERATLLQFSSAFCAPCRATRRVLGDVAAATPGVVHIDVDAEHHLDVVRRLGCCGPRRRWFSTPTGGSSAGPAGSPPRISFCGPSPHPEKAGHSPAGVRLGLRLHPVGVGSAGRRHQKVPRGLPIRSAPAPGQRRSGADGRSLRGGRAADRGAGAARHPGQHDRDLHRVGRRRVHLHRRDHRTGEDRDPAADGWLLHGALLQGHGAEPGSPVTAPMRCCSCGFVLLLPRLLRGQAASSRSSTGWASTSC